MSIQDDIIAAAKKYGVDPATMLAIAQIESKFDPNAYNKSGASGVFQFMPGTASDYGLSDPFNAAANIDAGARLARDNTAALTKVLGRAPTAGELYLAHQQGLGGAKALLTHPELSAVDALSTIMSPARAKASVLQNGGSLDMTAGQFSGNWTGKADKYAANYAGTPGTALDAINAAAPNTSRISINPTAYAPTPAGLPTMDRSGIIPGPYQPTPAGLPTMDRSGGSTLLANINPSAYQPTPAGPKTGTYGLSPNTGLPIKLGGPIGRTASDGKTSTTTFGLGPDGRTAVPVSHTSPPLVDVLKEAGLPTVAGGMIRAKIPEAVSEVSQQVSNAATAKIADVSAGVGSAWNSLFGGGGPAVSSAPKFDYSNFYKPNTGSGVVPATGGARVTPETTPPRKPDPNVIPYTGPGASLSYPPPNIPAQRPKMTALDEYYSNIFRLSAPGAVPKANAPAFDYSSFYKPNAPAAAPQPPPPSTFDYSTFYGSPVPAPTLPTVPQSYMDSYYATAGTGTGIPAAPVAAPMMSPPVAPPPLQQVNVVPVAKPKPITQPSDLDVLAAKLKSAGYQVTGNKKGFVGPGGSLRPTTTMSGSIPNYLKGL